MLAVRAAGAGASQSRWRRLHVLDLARELAALGHEVRFYEVTPPSRTASFGLPAMATPPPLVAPLAACSAPAPRCCEKPRLRGRRHYRASATVRRLHRHVGPRTGGGAVCTPAVGADAVQRGSRHILSQRDILAEDRVGEGAERPRRSRAVAGLRAGRSHHGAVAACGRQLCALSAAAKLFVDPTARRDSFPSRQAKIATASIICSSAA